MSDSDLDVQANSVRSRADLAAFIEAPRKDLESHQDEWQNPDLWRYLEAMAGWVQDMDGYYRNHGIPFSEDHPWNIMADILYAARSYE